VADLRKSRSSSIGHRPVPRWYGYGCDLDESDRNIIGQDLMRVQYRWPVGMPLCRALRDGLWEVRSDLASNRIARVLFSVQQGKLLVLHGFIKKSQKTPNEDLTLALRRKREFEP
jgi:phage-related protein